MAEQSQQAEHPQLREQRQREENEPVVRGDGTVLQESDKKRNPKKKMWEEGSEEAKQEQKKAEEAQKQKDKDEL
jgi:protein transport protein SEC20